MPGKELTLDPADWNEFRKQAHHALDEIVDYLAGIRQRPVWQPIPPEVKTRLRDATLPETGMGLEKTLEEFRQVILPYPTGNIHPRFWSWMAGAGTPAGLVADLLASGMNSIALGIDDTAASYVELQVLDWLKQLFGFPSDASGLLMSGGSMANFVGLAAGRTARHPAARAEGMHGAPPLVVYASTETHSSVQKAVEALGIGRKFYRLIRVNENFEIDLPKLRAAIERDRAGGLVPAILVGNAGTINTGAIDPLDELANIAQEHDLWLHVDGAFGAAPALLDAPPENLHGLSRVDSLAFDLHKWFQQPYNTGAVLIRDAAVHRETFNVSPPYLDSPGGGLAAGPMNFNALGMQLSRSFAALRVWLSFKTYGVEKLRVLIRQNMEQAQYLASLIEKRTELEIFAPVPMNVVNFRYRPAKDFSADTLDALNKAIVVALQERGVAAPSTTRIHGRLSIRVAIANHRTVTADFEMLVDVVLTIGRSLAADFEKGPE